MSKQIIFISGKDPLEAKGGHSSYVRAHARAAIRLGFEPQLFCVAPESGVVDSDFGVVRRTASLFDPNRPLMVPWHAPSMSADVTRFLRDRRGPALIHGFGLWGYVGVAVKRRLRNRDHPVIVIVSSYVTMRHEALGKLVGVNKAHGAGRRLRELVAYAWTRLALERYERRMHRESSVTLVNYDSVWRLISEQYPDARLRRLPYTSEVAFLPESAEPPEPPRDLAALEPRDAPLIVAVSRQDPRKGVDVLIKALAELRGRGVPFRACLVGGGVLLAAHRRLAERLGLGARAILTGRVEDAHAYLRHGDVFALPSLEEGSGSVALLEAMQAGVPIVASGIDGIPEDVSHEESALLVEPGNVAQLSQALARVLTDVELRRRLARRAGESFAERFSAEGFTRALGDLYAELGFEGGKG